MLSGGDDRNRTIDFVHDVTYTFPIKRITVTPIPVIHCIIAPIEIHEQSIGNLFFLSVLIIETAFAVETVNIIDEFNEIVHKVL